jgi:hypothetical protein
MGSCVACVPATELLQRLDVDRSGDGVCRYRVAFSMPTRRTRMRIAPWNLLGHRREQYRQDAVGRSDEDDEEPNSFVKLTQVRRTAARHLSVRKDVCCWSRT